MSQRRVIGLATLAALLGASLPVGAAESVEALIKRQSQEFSDASASGDKAVLDRYLDDRVAFMVESGELATKKDLLEGAGPAPAGISKTLTQTDFTVQLHGTVAVTSFTDELNEDFHGQPFHARFRSTEVWLNEHGRWRMISSQTLALPEDPPAVTLPAQTLDQYAGTYQAGPGASYRIARDGDGLTGALGDEPPRPLKAELLDVLFTPGQPRLRKIFRRDTDGRITGFVSRREGHDLLFQRLS